MSGSVGASAYRGRENAIAIVRSARVIWDVMWVTCLLLYAAVSLFWLFSDLGHMACGLGLSVLSCFNELSVYYGSVVAYLCFRSYVSMLCGPRMDYRCRVDGQLSLGRPSRAFFVSGIMICVDDVRVGSIPGGVMGVVVVCTLRNETNDVREFDPDCVRVMGDSGKRAVMLPNLCTDELCRMHLAPGETVSGVLVFSHVRPVSVDVRFLGNRLSRGVLVG